VQFTSSEAAQHPPSAGGHLLQRRIFS